MLYFDYDWDLSPNGILLDRELDTDQLNWKTGDFFKSKRSMIEKCFDELIPHNRD